MFGKKNIRLQRRQSANVQHSGPVYSYYSSRSEQNSGGKHRILGRLEKSKIVKWWHHIPSIIASVAIVGSIGYLLALNTNPKIIQSGSNNNMFTWDINTYQIAAHKLFEQSFLNKNKITVNISGISRSLKRQFPELDEVTITMPFFSHRPLVYILSSSPSMVIDNKIGTYILNNRGIVIKNALQVPQMTHMNLPKVTDNSGLDAEVGKGLLQAEDVKFIVVVFEQLSTLKQKIKSITLPTTANELDVAFSNQPYFVKMNMRGDPKEQVGALMAATSKLKQGSRPRQYIDMRVSGRVFYK